MSNRISTASSVCELSRRSDLPLLLTLRAHALEGYSSHFVCLSVCLSSVANLEDGGLLALQRDMRLNWMTIYVPLICKFGLVLNKM